MNAVIYILQSKGSGRYYIGSTNNLERRLKQHLSGHTHSTKRLGDMELVFSQSFPSLEKARLVERKLKSWKRRDLIKKIIEDGRITAVN